jgi:hypothetical protein
MAIFIMCVNDSKKLKFHSQTVKSQLDSGMPTTVRYRISCCPFPCQNTMTCLRVAFHNYGWYA